jgi:hypothetical protein
MQRSHVLLTGLFSLLVAFGCTSGHSSAKLTDDATSGQSIAPKRDGTEPTPLGTYRDDTAIVPGEFLVLMLRSDGVFHRERITSCSPDGECESAAEDGAYTLTQSGDTNELNFMAGDTTLDTYAYELIEGGIRLRQSGERTEQELLTASEAFCQQPDDCLLQGLADQNCEPGQIGQWQCADQAFGSSQACAWQCGLTCHPITNAGCEEGQRCALVSSVATACLAEGALEHGASCDPADDQCQHGLACVAGREGGPTCRTLCAHGAGCAQDERCSLVVSAELSLGACDRDQQCSIQQQDCPAGYSCLHEVVGPGQTVGHCIARVGDTPLGGACRGGDFADCPVGALCVSQSCYQYCSPRSDEMPCPTELKCSPLRDMSDLGVCI